MKRGYLSQYFKGVAFKTLSAVEVNPKKSNQHEFNGVKNLKNILGSDKRTYNNVKFIYLRDGEESLDDQGFLTWYDAREFHATRTEYRLYFSPNKVSKAFAEGDYLFICILPDDTLLIIVTEKLSTIGNQLIWLFGIQDPSSHTFMVRDSFNTEKDGLVFASRIILGYIGISIEEPSNSYLADLLSNFKGCFPSTKEFSRYARSTVGGSFSDPDKVLMTWMDREEVLFRTLERYIIESRLKQGFKDVDEFISFSLSVQNRRKSRAGQALENHVEQILIDHNLSYSRTPTTENKSKPDFIFPSIEDYHNPFFAHSDLTMLGVKSTCKDRWRQVLSEAKKISHKHLLTLEPAISKNQTDEMSASNLTLVIPQSLHNTYTPVQQKILINFSEFIELISIRQKNSGT